MNQIYKVIWSRVKRCYVVVSEIAGSNGKNGGVASEKKEPAFPCISVCSCPYRMPDAERGGGKYAVWAGCFRYRR